MMRRRCIRCGAPLRREFPFYDLPEDDTDEYCGKCRDMADDEERDEEGDEIWDTDEVLVMSFGSSYEGRREG